MQCFQCLEKFDKGGAQTAPDVDIVAWGAEAICESFEVSDNPNNSSENK